MVPDLTELGKEFKTTKVKRGFLPIYEKYLKDIRKDHIHLIEIGVDIGQSLRMWRKYLPNAKITALERIVKCSVEGCEIIYCDASNLGDIPDHLDKADIIIDDASHIAREQIAAFESLFPILKPGGYYVIEDLYTIYDANWGHLNDGFFNPVEMVRSKMRSILTEGDEIQEVHYYGGNYNNGILFLRKRYDEFKEKPQV